jgi:hypothetical protein
MVVSPTANAATTAIVVPPVWVLRAVLVGRRDAEAAAVKEHLIGDRGPETEIQT